jgi:hypothetical protein
MDRELGTITLTKAESALLLEYVVKSLGRKRTKKGTVEHDVHQKVWDAWSELHEELTEEGLAVDIEEDVD